MPSTPQSLVIALTCIVVGLAAAETPAPNAAPPAAAASTSAVDETSHLDPAAFDFVKPGVARAEVDKRLGDPYVSSVSVVAADRIDLFLDEAPTEESNPQGAPQPTEDVHYYDYRPDKFSSEYARIVFRKDKVWYAMLPPKSLDTSVEKAQARYGKPFVTSKIHKADGHILSVIVVHRIPDLGVGLVEVPGRGITHRLVFPPEKTPAVRAEQTLLPSAADAWLLVLDSWGGYAGHGMGGVTIASDGRVFAHRLGRRANNDCFTRLAEAELQALTRAISAAEPSTWSTSYEPAEEKACCDFFTWLLRLHHREADGAERVTHTGWHEASEGLPQDLLAVATIARRAMTSVLPSCKT